MVYGSPADVKLVEQYISIDEFRQALGGAPAGIFTQDPWIRWHRELGIELFRHCRGAGFQMVAWDWKLGDSWGDRLFSWDGRAAVSELTRFRVR